MQRAGKFSRPHALVTVFLVLTVCHHHHPHLSAVLGMAGHVDAHHVAPGARKIELDHATLEQYMAAFVGQ